MNAALQMMTETFAEAHDQQELGCYERCIKASKRVRWDIDADVLRGRSFDFNRKFLPDGLTKVQELEFLDEPERCLFSQVQGRTYANVFRMVERFIGAKALELACSNNLGDQTVLEGLVRFSDEEIKHQELFRRIELMLAARMDSGYVFFADPSEVARVVLSKPQWAVLALTCHVELFTQSHYRESLEHDLSLSDLFRDVFRYHWLEECQHVAMDEIEWRREHRRLSKAQRDHALQALIDLILMLDGILKAQAAGDAAYFLRACQREHSAQQQIEIRRTLLKAYRWQYIGSGFSHPRLNEIFQSLLTPGQITVLREAVRFAL